MSAQKEERFSASITVREIKKIKGQMEWNCFQELSFLHGPIIYHSKSMINTLL